MKVTHFDTEERVAYLQLSRRNLLALLAKLDQNAEETVAATAESRPVNRVAISKCTIISPPDRHSAGMIAVTAVEDIEHYSDRDPGPMTAETESRVRATVGA